MYIISSAPKHVFATAIALGAIYRSVEIDPVILQPLAFVVSRITGSDIISNISCAPRYHVDRQKSIKVLESFMNKKEQKVEEETHWLREIKADCILSDAAFLALCVACFFLLTLARTDNHIFLSSLAAHKARVPSVLITNFTFDSIYSLLSASFIQQFSTQHLPANPVSFANHPLEPDTPIPEGTLSPLVQQIFEGYRHADMLLLLPGAIPIPSFGVYPPLPSTQWIDPVSRLFKPDIARHLVQDPHTYTLHPSIPFSPSDHSPSIAKLKPRSARLAPLLVRSPNDDIYTPEGRSCFLSSIGVERELHDPINTKILIVSFGGQVFHKPSRSRTPSRPESPGPQLDHKHSLNSEGFTRELSQELALLSKRNCAETRGQVFGSSHIFVPGAPAPAFMPSPSLPTVTTIPPTPTLSEFSNGSASLEQENLDVRSLMLPDASWIAVVCGVADSHEWRTGRCDAGSTGISSVQEDSDLPEGFYIAPRDVYMPDLMAVGDVLLGKLVRLTLR